MSEYSRYLAVVVDNNLVTKMNVVEGRSIKEAIEETKIIFNLPNVRPEEFVILGEVANRTFEYDEAITVCRTTLPGELIGIEHNCVPQFKK